MPIRTLADQQKELAFERGPLVGRPWIEPVWDLPSTEAAAPAIQNMASPVDLVNQHFDGLVTTGGEQFDTEEAQIQAAIQPNLDTSYEKYKLDVSALDRLNLDADERQRRLEGLNTQYQKQWVDIRAKARPNLEALTQKRQALQGRLAMDRAERLLQIQTIQDLVDDGTISKGAGLQKQYAIAGITLPQSEFEPPKPQTPKQRLAEIEPILKAWYEKLRYYRHDPKTGQLQIVKPEARDPENQGIWNPKKDYMAVPEDQQAQIESLWSQYTEGLRERNTLREQIIGRRMPDILGAVHGTVGPIAQIVARAQAMMPEQAQEEDVTTLSDEELRRIAGIQ